MAPDEEFHRQKTLFKIRFWPYLGIKFDFNRHISATNQDIFIKSGEYVEI